jgi:hypothetical protein
VCRPGVRGRAKQNTNWREKQNTIPAAKEKTERRMAKVAKVAAVKL